ncbi:MAG: hypothetical protein MUO91_03775 [candidate division Zixibacteria bacterium]|nr:hypothetical protein [candidate division Zixibacteria bacterium]
MKSKAIPKSDRPNTPKTSKFGKLKRVYGRDKEADFCASFFILSATGYTTYHKRRREVNSVFQNKWKNLGGFENEKE